MEWLTVFIYVLTVRTCLSRSIIEKTWKTDDRFQLIPAMVKILTSCYEDQLNAVGLGGNSDAFLINALQSSTSVPVTLIDNTRRFVNHGTVQRIHRYKLQLFIVKTSSATELKKILTAIKSTLWWNHEASVLILAWIPISEDGCSRAFELLSIAWKMDLLNTKMMCLHATKEIWIYNYNPFMPLAPDCWKEENTYSGEDGHPFTLFKRRYEDKEICNDLDFNKTRDLGGYRIRSSIKNYPGSLSIATNQTGKFFEGPLGEICNVLFRALNATPNLLLYNQTGRMSFLDQTGRDIVMDPVEGHSDILLNQRLATLKKDITVTYPHVQGGLGILTKPSPPLSQLSKITSVVDRSSRRGICLVILITLLYFIFFLRQKVVPAMLNTLRLICDGSLLSIPENLSPRFYLGSLFVFIVVVQAIYQGQLAALLTKPMYLPNVETVQDLVDREYTVYYYKSLQRLFSPTEFGGRGVQLSKFSCVEYVVNNSSNACLLPFDWLVEIAIKYQMHLPNNNFFRRPVSFIIRDDWPLESTLNKIITSLFESYVFSRLYLATVQPLLDIHDLYEKHKDDEKYESIGLGELTFAFIIFAIGLICATVSFIVEIGFHFLNVKERARIHLSSCYSSINSRIKAD